MDGDPGVADGGRAPIVLTGAGGFIGRRLCEALVGAVPVRAVSRRLQGLSMNRMVEIVPPGDATDAEAWGDLVRGASAVVHLAARVHQTVKSADEEALAAFRRSNTAATLTLARAAADAGVRRFIFTSTSQVHGDRSDGANLREDSPLRPLTPYARSKAEAEEGLARISESTGLEVTVFRPPMVYGPGAAGNFQRLRRLVESGVPLPLGPGAGRRSFLFLGNLIEAIQASLGWEEPAGTYLVSDPDPLTVASLVVMMRRAIDRPPHLLPIPSRWLRGLAAIFGRVAEVDKLTLPFELSIDRLRTEREWTPPFTTAEGIRRTMLAGAR